ncbi:MAG: two-component system NtrC family sensor histidine kinase [Geobacteraceae bacterium]|nr:MAG: two-component system NtrC family sensor histidine kinase [Geobacteraceae bacterium]
MDEKKRLAWFILVRVVVVSLFLASTIILNIKEPQSIPPAALAGLIKLIITTYLFSIISLLVIKFSEKFQPLLTYAQIIWDIFFVTLLLLLTGGISSPYSFLYMLSIINASVLLARRQAIYTASLCGILYGALLDLQYYGKLTAFGLSQLPALQSGAGYIFYTIFVNIGAFYLTAFLTGYLAERMRRSERALREKVIDYEELDRLNRSIVSNLNSGLLTINNEGKIRVFNHYAEILTGITQAEAYNKPLYAVLPSLRSFGGEIDSVERGEFDYRAQNGDIMTIGFKSAPLTDNKGSRDGIIIIFQDLTQVKRLEEELKRADRLAAIGELSAHIAHEIRNPLSSISGSAQLIAQGEGIDPKDKKLLDIVVRETDRLNELIKSFLAYARPTRPAKSPVQLKELLSVVESLSAADPRFHEVVINNRCREDLSLMGDHDQLEQVFWNLLVNAAEAMPDGGEITLDAEVVNSDSRAPRNGKMARIVVADTGKGMDKDEMSRVFEPFFSTKKEGTGLGLATVYRIVEAHGGRIMVESAKGGGTRFTIYLPAELPGEWPLP